MTAAADDTGWAAALDAFEARLIAVRDALASGDPDQVAPFDAPQLGAMPAELHDRARRLFARSQELEQLIIQARSAVGTRLSAARKQAGQQKPARRTSRLDIAM